MDRQECLKCKHYKVLNPHHIVEGTPVKSCDVGEVPENCKKEERNETRRGY